VYGTFVILVVDGPNRTARPSVRGRDGRTDGRTDGRATEAQIDARPPGFVPGRALVGVETSVDRLGGSIRLCGSFSVEAI